MKTYSAPYIVSVTPTGREGIILTSGKPVVVFLSAVLAEGRDDGSGVKPLENGGHGIFVQDIGDESKYEFDTVREAMDFVKSQQNPDKNPLSVTVLQFRDEKWQQIGCA